MDDIDWDDLDWSNCEDVERTPGKVSGSWCVKDTRLPVWAILENTDSSPEEICDMFPGLGLERARRILEYAWRHEEHPDSEG